MALIHSFTNIELISLLNQTKDILTAGLLSEGVISEDVASDINRKYTITVVEKGTLGRFWDRIWNSTNSNDNPIILLVKPIPTSDED